MWLLNQKIYYLLLFVILCTYVAGMLVPLMEVDAAQYASISDQLLHGKSFLQIKHRHFEYLDKPPLLFWLSAVSITLFGVNSFAYKIPSVLGLLLGVYSTYKFCNLYYKKETSLVAATILASCQAFFTIANDCRTDNLLIGFACFSIWKISSYITRRKSIDLFLGFAGTGLAMLAKGPLGLVFPAFTIGSMLIANKHYKTINWKWLLAIPIISLLLLPMCIGLYQQHGKEGLEFYFWTQSFGRITGQSEWENNTDPLFFVHSFLWSFLPFTIIFLVAIYSSIKDLIRNKSQFKSIEFASIGGFIFTMIALSFSKYKLPHYIFIVCPLAAAICSGYLVENYKTLNIKVLYLIQKIFLAILLIFSVALIYFFNQSYPSYYYIALVALIYLSWLFHKRFDMRKSIVLISILTFTFVNFEFNTLFYPKLLKYQSSSEAAFYIRDNHLNADNVVGYNAYGHALSFYLDTIVPYYWDIGDVKKLEPGTIVYTNNDGLLEMEKNDMNFQVIKTFNEFNVTLLKFQFLNPATREDALNKRYLARLKHEQNKN
jgi:4-amino-4-deoxy-L-arabinose transferase-like glycosyltransferase